jgi:hypothetical protein
MAIEGKPLQAAGRTLRATRGPCPLCGEPATMIDWRPRMDWVTVEGCRCDGFFVEGRLIGGRLATLPATARQELAHRVRQVRAMGDEARCTASDGTAHGPLVIETARPDRST